MDAGFFVYAGDFVQQIVNGLVGPVSGRVIDMLNAFAITGLALYILLYGISMSFGLVQSPHVSGIIKIIKIAFVFGVALSSSVYGTLFLTFFIDFRNGVLSAIDPDAIDIYDTLDNAFNSGMDIVRKCLEKGDNASWFGGGWIGWYFAAFVVVVATLLVVLVGGAGVLAAELALAILFSVGPLFIFCLAFEWTSRFFTSYFSQVMNFTFVIIFLSIAMGIAIVGFSTFIDGADFSGDGEVNPVIASIQVFGFSCLLVFMVYVTYGMAAAVSGGLSMSALTLAHIANPAKMVNNTVNPRSTRTDKVTGKTVTASRAGHAARGAAKAIYRRSGGSVSSSK